MKDNIKNYLGWSLILLVLVLVFSSISYVSTYKHSVPPLNTFGVSGEGKVVIVPDVAEFNFSVITEGGSDIARLQTDNVQKINKAIDYLKSQDIDEKDIKTEGYDLSPRYQRCVRSLITQVCPPPTIVGYTITQRVSVKVRDFDIVGELLSGVVESGANTVSQLNFTIDDPEAARAEAREEAIEQAQNKAKAIAKAAGFSIGRLVSIDEGGYRPAPFYGRVESMAMGGEMMDEAIAPAIEPGSEEVVVTVNLRYEIR
ncbi:MAG: SIMPL domain-containing protein [Patescibacteria group bacterium]|nr:SIMPL domain-containing protein [Patescibacteria group bacterium]